MQSLSSSSVLRRIGVAGIVGISAFVSCKRQGRMRRSIRSDPRRCHRRDEMRRDEEYEPKLVVVHLTALKGSTSLFAI